MIKLPAEIDERCDTENCDKIAVLTDEETDQYLCLMHAGKLEFLRAELVIKEY